MPDVGAFAYLVTWFVELGLTPTYRDIDAWQRVTKTETTAWESSVLIRMSREYQLEKTAAEDPARAAPYTHDERTVDQQRADVMAKFKALAKRKGVKNGGHSKPHLRS